jgi:lipopolysaccharide biosynthesis protein
LPARLEPVAGDIAQILESDRVVVLAEYSLGPHLRAEALAGATAWAAAGMPALIVSARDAWSPAALQVDDLPDGVAVVRRPNVGYDFGSWGAALQAFPELAGKRLVVLTNDSLAGPYGPLDGVLARIEASSADVWSATANRLPQWHLQSFLLAFRGGVLAREPLRGFFASVRAQETKRAVIQTYELGLSGLAREHGLTTDVGWSNAALQLSESDNPVLHGWARMLASGFPFVKRALLEERWFADYREAIVTVVRQEYGAEVR